MDTAQARASTGSQSESHPRPGKGEGGVELEESIGLESALPVAQQPVRDAGDGDADVAGPAGS